MSLEVKGYEHQRVLVRRVHKGRVCVMFWSHTIKATLSCNRSAVTILLAVDAVLLGSCIYVCVKTTGVIGVGQESTLHRQSRQTRPLSASASSVFGVAMTPNALFSPACRLFIFKKKGQLTPERACKHPKTSANWALSPPPVTAWHEWVRRRQCEHATTSHLISGLHENLFVLDRVCNKEPASLREFSSN